MVSPQALRWTVTGIHNPECLRISFSDGEPVENVKRGGSCTSSRLVVQTQGFLDVTTMVMLELSLAKPLFVLDFNDLRLVCLYSSAEVVPITVSFAGDGNFTASIDCPTDTSLSSEYLRTKSVSGSLKPFPAICDEDVACLNDMIAQNVVPYPNVPDEPGKTDEEIRELGLRLFPWTPQSYQLAMCVYDWTTASFARMVFLKVFEYTAIPSTPHPLDLASIAQMIWESHWGTFNPSDPAYMRSFLMRPAPSLAAVSAQLHRVHAALHRLSDAQNRLLAAALHALPRTCTAAARTLFSGQVDMRQMGTHRFGAELREFPGNAGPVGRALAVPLSAALAGFLRPGARVTTKTCWSFSDSEPAARGYANGILLVAEPPEGRAVWDGMAYVTPLSTGPDKVEYVFPPGSAFRVRAVEGSEEMRVIRLQAVLPESMPEDEHDETGLLTLSIDDDLGAGVQPTPRESLMFEKEGLIFDQVPTELWRNVRVDHLQTWGRMEVAAMTPRP